MQDKQPSTSGRQGQSTVWAAIINFERQGRAENGEAEARSDSKKAPRYIVDVLANCVEDSLPGRGPKRCCFRLFAMASQQDRDCCTQMQGSGNSAHIGLLHKWRVGTGVLTSGVVNIQLVWRMARNMHVCFSHV